MVNETKKKVCPLCEKVINDNALTTVCPQCGVVHHRKCWESNNGCCTQNCLAAGTHTKDIKEIAYMQHRKYSPALNKAAPAEKKVSSHEMRPKTPKSSPEFTAEKTSYETSRKNAVKEPENQESEFIGYNRDGQMDEYMQALIQKNIYYYDQKFSMMNNSAKSASWNWASFFLGSYWMVYRKMYAYTALYVLFVILNVFISCIPVVGFILSFVLSLTLMICMGIFGNAIYKNHIEKKYEQAYGLSREQRKQTCLQVGGTSGLAVFLYILIFTLLGTLISGVLLFFGLLSLGLSIL